MNLEPEALAATCAHLADEGKADNIVVLCVAPLTTITDHFVIVTARNPRHLRALCVGIMAGVDRLGVNPLGKEGTPESGWVVLDLGDVIVHLFNPHTREIYDLEVLWGDAPAVDWRAEKPLAGATGQ